MSPVKITATVARPITRADITLVPGERVRRIDGDILATVDVPPDSVDGTTAAEILAELDDAGIPGHEAWPVIHVAVERPNPAYAGDETLFGDPPPRTIIEEAS